MADCWLSKEEGLTRLLPRTKMQQIVENKRWASPLYVDGGRVGLKGGGGGKENDVRGAGEDVRRAGGGDGRPRLSPAGWKGGEVLRGAPPPRLRDAPQQVREEQHGRIHLLQRPLRRGHPEGPRQTRQRRPRTCLAP